MKILFTKLPQTLYANTGAANFKYKTLASSNISQASCMFDMSSGSSWAPSLSSAVAVWSASVDDSPVSAEY